MLVVRDVAKKFGNLVALSGISFKVKSGEIVALLGKNGAGKSTLLKIISGYMEPDFGSVVFDNINQQTNRLEFLNVSAYVPENLAIYQDMNVFEFLKFNAEMRNGYYGNIERKVIEISDLLDLGGVLIQKCKTLSKGYKKRVAIAAALITNSSLLLFDEPTEGLDPVQKRAFYKILKKLSKNHYIIISTHLMEDVEAIADRVVMIDSGALIHDVSLEKFKAISKTNLMDSFNLAVKE